MRADDHFQDMSYEYEPPNNRTCLQDFNPHFNNKIAHFQQPNSSLTTKTCSSKKVQLLFFIKKSSSRRSFNQIHFNPPPLVQENNIFHPLKIRRLDVTSGPSSMVEPADCTTAAASCTVPWMCNPWDDRRTGEGSGEGTVGTGWKPN